MTLSALALIGILIVIISIVMAIFLCLIIYFHRNNIMPGAIVNYPIHHAIIDTP